MENVIVTGGTGVTGTALVYYLLSIGVRVTALIRPNSIKKNYLPLHDNLTVIECSMDNYCNISDKLAQGGRFDAFFHLAWDGSAGIQKNDNRNNMFLQNKNVTNTLEAIELCKAIKCPVFVATGSQAEYGRCSELINENTKKEPENGYGWAKLCAGQMTRILCKQYGIKHIWARLFSIYGPYDNNFSLINTSIIKLLKGESPKYTKGEQMWDYLYSFDAARALYLLAEKGKNGEEYCVAHGNPQPLSDYISLLHHIVNPTIEPLLGEISYIENQVMNLRADITKLKEDTGFEPEYSFQRGITEIRNWTLHKIKEERI